MGIDSQGYCWVTPLHQAVNAEAFDAAKVLLELGANPFITDVNDQTPFNRCKDATAKELLQSVYQEQQRKEELARQEQKKQRLEEQEKEIAARIEGEWKPVSDHEIMFERELPGQSLRLREFFDFSAKSRRSLTNDLQNGQMSQETKYFSELPDEARAMIDQARAQLDKVYGGATPEKAPPAETRNPERQDFTLVQKVKL